MSVLQSQPRSSFGTRAAFRLRREGLLPAVIYGEGRSTEQVLVNRRDFETALRRHERVLDLEVGAAKQKVLVHQVQWDHLGDQLLHVDFLRVSKDQAVEVRVVVEYVGHPKGLSHGGEFLKHMTDLRVVCLPDAIPDSIPVKVAELDLNQAVYVRDLQLPEGVKVLAGPDEIVCAIHVRAAEPEAPAAVAEGPVEPELITKRKAEEEEEKEKK